MAEARHTDRLAVLLFDGVEELDFVGPWEVFTMAAMVGAPLACHTVGWPAREIACAKGLAVTADETLHTASPADIVLVPGGRGTRPLVQDDPFIATLSPYLSAAKWQVSVCTGAAVIGRCGLLDGKRATTNRNAFDFFHANAPHAELDRERRYVRDGSVVTAAGVSAGIDMALWLVGELYGESIARRTQSLMEYYPEPPYGTAL